MKFETPYGVTPLDYDEKLLLIPKHIYNMEELNAFEHANIVQAETWALRSKFLLLTSYIKNLHTKMFDKTWKWAGKFRQSEKNIGVDSYKILYELEYLLQDLKYQLENNIYDLDEMAARFHHRLVSIHCFSNGNGRHARLMTDLLLIKNNGRRFSWGGGASQKENNEVRKLYINALRQADTSNIQPLLDFVRA